MTALCNELEELVIDGAASEDADASLSEELDRLLAEWHSKAHRHYKPVEFKTYYGAMSTEDFVRDALAPAAELVSDLTFAEAHAVLEAVRSAVLPEWSMSHYLE